MDKATFSQAPTWHFRAQPTASPCLYFPRRGSSFFKTCPRTSPCLTPVSRELAPAHHVLLSTLERCFGRGLWEQPRWLYLRQEDTLVSLSEVASGSTPPQRPPPAPTSSRVLGTSFPRPLRPPWATSVLPQPSHQPKSKPGRQEGGSRGTLSAHRPGTTSQTQAGWGLPRPQQPQACSF